jgi:hypothetical protein
MKEWQKTALMFALGFAAVYMWKMARAANAETKRVVAEKAAKDAVFVGSDKNFGYGPFYDP